MRYLLAAVVILAASAATAQQPAPPPIVPPEYTLTVTPQDVDVIGAGLNELAAKISNPLAKKLQAQIDAQIAAANRKPEAKAETEAK